MRLSQPPKGGFCRQIESFVQRGALVLLSSRSQSCEAT
jgi:hypothetical protein